MLIYFCYFSRRNNKVSIRNIKPRKFKVAQAVTNPYIKKNYDKKLTPAQNLEKLGIESDANNLVCSKPDPSVDPKFKAFVGFAESSEGENTKSTKLKVLDELDMKYAKNCIKKHKLNYDAMFKDIKLNFNQLTANKLKKLCVAYLKQSNQSVEDYMDME
jgi:hypothetical protein